MQPRCSSYDHLETGQAWATSVQGRWTCGRCKVYITVPLHASLHAVWDSCWQLQNVHQRRNEFLPEKFLCLKPPKTCSQHWCAQAWPCLYHMTSMYSVPHNDTNLVQAAWSQGWHRRRISLAWRSQDGVVVFFQASEMRPNGVPSVPVVSAFLHNLCMSAGDIYDVNQMLVTLRLHCYLALGHRKKAVLRKRKHPALCGHLAPYIF